MSRRVRDEPSDVGGGFLNDAALLTAQVAGWRRGLRLALLGKSHRHCANLTVQMVLVLRLGVLQLCRIGLFFAHGFAGIAHGGAF